MFEYEESCRKIKKLIEEAKGRNTELGYANELESEEVERAERRVEDLL